MNHFTHSKYIILLSYLTECALLIYCLFKLSSKIFWLPWHKPLTTYILLDLLILLAIQFFLFIFYWWLRDSDYLFKDLHCLSLIHLLSLLILIFFSVKSISWFTISCYLFSLAYTGLLYLCLKYLLTHLKINKPKVL